MLKNFNILQDSERNPTIDKLVSGSYSEIIEKFLKSLHSDSSIGFHENLKDHLRINSNMWQKSNGFSETLAAGLACLFLFIQKNWIGPDVSLSEFLQSTFSMPDMRTSILKNLVLDGENVVSVVEFPELLYISLIIFEDAYNYLIESLVVKIWYLRCLFIQQQILEELSPVLFEKIERVIDQIKEEYGNLSKQCKIILHLEFGRVFMFYHNVQKSKKEIQQAANYSGIDISLSGALGKRTKFQVENLAQLIAKVAVVEENIFEDSEDEISSYPTDLKLNDDVRLDKIKFADDSSNSSGELSGLQQAVVMGHLFQVKKSQPKDGLADEELLSLIQCILDKPKIWSIRSTALLLRSLLEANHKRTVERSMMQLQVLVDDFNNQNVSLKERSSFFFVSYFPPKWGIRLNFANVLASMGSVKSALDIYLDLKDWENVIHCYNSLQLRHKAKEIILQELEKDSSPKLWCLLGDATDDVSCYEKAWELSNKRSARAQRHWALFYYFRQNYKDSIEHFEKSLEINSLQKEMWYRLGYAALMEEKWETSANAYRRYVVLEPECFEAWNNLGRCYCEMKQKQRAWRAIQEALKVDYSNWKVWDNYMVISSDLGMFDDVIKSYHEILNLKGKHLDIPILNSLVVGFKNIQTGSSENDNIDVKNKLKQKLLELFGRLTSQIINDSELWFLYSEVVDDDSPENLTKKHQILVKAHRSAVNKTNWEKNLENCNRIIYVLSKLVEVGLLIGKADVLLSCKLAANSALAKISKEYPDADTCESLKKNLLEIDGMLNA